MKISSYLQKPFNLLQKKKKNLFKIIIIKDIFKVARFTQMLITLKQKCTKKMFE